MKVVFAERARQDISDIYDSIAQHNRSAAQRVEDTIRADCDRLGAFPYASATTDEPNVRRLPMVRFRYTIFCRINDERRVVEIARVVHSARVKDRRQLPEDD